MATVQTDIVQHNPGQPDAFGYSIAFVKATGGQTYSVTQYVAEIDVWESLFAKAMCCKLGVFDGGGLMETIALQPGDIIRVTIYADEEGDKLIKDFLISEITGGNRTDNSAAKTYNVSGMSRHAYNNMKANVYRGFSSTYSDMLKKVCSDYLGLDDVDIESTVGNTTIVSPGKPPFKVIGQLMTHAVSGRWGPEDSFFFFYEDRDKVRFKTLKSIVTDAKVHPFIVSVDKNVDGPTDLIKIQHYSQLKAGSQTERINSGMFENEIVEVDFLSRTFGSKKFSYEKAGDQLRMLGQGDIVDKANNVKDFVNESASTIRGLSNLVKWRVADESFDREGTMRDKYGTMVAQKALFNQLIYAVQIFGNPGIKAGDIVDVTSPALSMQGDAPSLDNMFQGRFLVGDVRHRIVNGEQYLTVLNLFKDGFETANVREESK
jgi:hypothetical protein